jgi:hypothetical protein
VAIPERLRCPFQPCEKHLTDRHEHVWPQAEQTQRQCHCGSRRWVISLGGMLPPQVMCERNRHTSRINTAYELGRRDGKRRADDRTAPPPF